jgi:fucose 4-O-acetylase-like acetyltransferase
MINQTKTGTETKAYERDYLFDNMRAVLIILIVWGHVLTSMISHSNSIRIIYYFIFFFHMPAMTFISGYFSKNLEKIRNNAIAKLFIPYLVLNVMNYLFKMCIMREDFYQFRAFRPYWGLWYLFCLFVWKFFLKDIVRFRNILLFSFCFAIISGFSKEFSEYMALGRIVCFLPFFLLGYYCTKEHVEKIRRIPKMISLAVIAADGLLSVFLVKFKITKSTPFLLREPYPIEHSKKYMLLRLIIYVMAVAMTIAVINLMSSRKSFLSKIGANTMTVYIFHLFVIPILEKYHILEDNHRLYFVYSIAVTVLIVFLFSRQIVKKAYDSIMDMFVDFAIKK